MDFHGKCGMSIIFSKTKESTDCYVTLLSLLPCNLLFDLFMLASQNPLAILISIKNLINKWSDLHLFSTTLQWQTQIRCAGLIHRKRALTPLYFFLFNTSTIQSIFFLRKNHFFGIIGLHWWCKMSLFWYCFTCDIRASFSFEKLHWIIVIPAKSNVESTLSVYGC